MANLSLTERAARISTTNPSAGRLLLKISEAETASEIQTALNEFSGVFMVTLPKI